MSFPRPVFILFARAPRLGGVKRRLTAGIGAVPALRFYRNQLARISRELRPFEAVIFVTPRGARWPGQRRPARPQSAGDLGARMTHAFNQYRSRPVILIGADIPGLGRAILRAAARALAHHDAVFGPAADGGYYLAGMARRRPARPFAGVRWSSEHALADTLRNFCHLRVAQLPVLADIDTAENLKNHALNKHCGAAQKPVRLRLVAESVSYRN